MSETNVAVLERQVKELQQMLSEMNGGGKPTPKRRGPKPTPFADRFRRDLEPGREVSVGYRKTYDMMMQEVGKEIRRHVKEQGFTPQLFAATMKAYYGRDGRDARRR